MKIKANGDGSWKLIGAPAGAKLKRVTITFPSVKSHAGGKTTDKISGPPKVNLKIQLADGTFEIVKNTTIDWG